LGLFRAAGAQLRGPRMMIPALLKLVLAHNLRYGLAKH
jgi:hypothetical protein